MRISNLLIFVDSVWIFEFFVFIIKLCIEVNWLYKFNFFIIIKKEVLIKGNLMIV